MRDDKLSNKEALEKIENIVSSTGQGNKIQKPPVIQTKPPPPKVVKNNFLISITDKAIIQMTTTTRTLKKMFASIEESLKEKLNIISSIKKDNAEKQEWQGEHFGLNKVKQKMEDIERNAVDPNWIDIKPFGKLDVELLKEIDNKKPVKANAPAFNKGYFYGLEEGRSFIDALYRSEIYKQAERQISNNKTIKGGRK